MRNKYSYKLTFVRYPLQTFTAMKTKFALLFTLFSALISLAQNGINYKAVINNNLANVVANQANSIQFAVLKGTAKTNVYSETQNPTTDANGIIIVNIGTGTLVSGNFNDNDWGDNNHFLNVKINTGNGLTDMGITEFMPVPYALYAKNVEGAVHRLYDLEAAKSWNTSIYIGRDARLNDGFYDYENKSVGIGFEALKLNRAFDNTVIGYKTLTANTIGNLNTTIGHTTLTFNTTGSKNTAMGAGALFFNTTGKGNTANGTEALNKNETGASTTAHGVYALYTNHPGNNNSAYGREALNRNSAQMPNVKA